MATKGHPPSISDAVDDPLLPFVIAARAGDGGAERELLVRLAPAVLEVSRHVLGTDERKIAEISLESLIATLRALPTFRGEDAVLPAVARMTLERARRSQGQRSAGLSDEEILVAAERRAKRGPRAGDSAKISTLVELALKDDAAVLVSQFVRRRPPKATRAYVIAAVVALALAGFVGFLLTRTHT